ncbi:uncharacterized protein LOC131845341 [Achroia grisella]|uniref:uncharacterized protein LOC131845341 n=1 Tax=Achroia grisella TaxID=688607 RepID=UPI0027D26B3A|nr:uncharacterized protein LOC131845341 [Achroia grisella]
MLDHDDEVSFKKKTDSQIRRAKFIVQRRASSTIVPEKQRHFITPNKTRCKAYTCFPHEDPYKKTKKLNPCLKSPTTLYEMAEQIVNRMRFPDALSWSVEDVTKWMVDLGLPQYQECIKENCINGTRLLMLEDPSKLPEINIHDFKDIQLISNSVRQLFRTEFIRFTRSIALPTRKPLTLCTWFKSRTGPNWGIRKNWNRCDLLRGMEIIMGSPVYRDHWDLVWYQKPDFPKVMFARVPKPESQVHIPHYKPIKEVCNEFMVPRKFRIQTGIPEEDQMIWMEHRPGSLDFRREKHGEGKKKEKKMLTIPKECRLMPKKVSLTGLTGKNLILARRKMAIPKFLP